NTVDIFVKTNTPVLHLKKRGKLKVDKNCIAYPLGDKILITHLEHQVGGGGTNTAVAFSRAGLRTAYLGKIGKDDSGLSVFRLLKQENVSFVGVLGKETGTSVVLDSIKDDRTILTYKGCNNDLKFSELNFRKLRTDWFYFSSMIGESFKTISKLSDYAHKANIKVAMNPSSYLVSKGMAYLSSVLKTCDILVLNREEAQTLSKKNNIKDIVRVLKEKVQDFVVVTDAKNGAYCYDGEFLMFAKPKSVKIVETTGAGDAFASGFVAGIALGKGKEFAFRMGFLESESVIQAYGAKNDLLFKSKLFSLAKKDNRKIVNMKLTMR
ncbi:carbohydrate kinase family protein, partial [Candidatus Woesearchaeota archaeon]|nr:carbohydrate kinase family protein [Candidatus Woesearchaeota archaeon]